MIARRRFPRALAVLLTAALAAPAGAPPVARAAEELKIALVAPLSGRWARQGQLKKMGAEMAIDEINAQGGIKSLGGAKIVLREADAGDSVEKAVSAAQRALSREKISAGIGSWLSSFTLGVTEVAERLAGAVVHALLRRQHHRARLQVHVPVEPDLVDPGRAGARPPRRPRQAQQPADQEGGDRRRQHRGHACSSSSRSARSS